MGALIDQLKDLGSALAGVSACGYVFGYLALRAKAHALGTNPVFKLVDEAYVFAGFRLLFVSLIVVLLSSPVLFGLRSGWQWLAPKLPRGSAVPIAWCCLVLAVVLTLYNLRILGSSGVLLDEVTVGRSDALKQAILGGGGAVFWIFVVTLAPLLCGAWWISRVRLGHSPFEWILGITVALQLALLPLYHGALLADRKVRILASKPAGLDALVEPVGVVDQTGEQATLLSLDSQGRRVLTGIKAEDLNRIQTYEVTQLPVFLRRLDAHAQASFHAAATAGVVLTDSATTQPAVPMSPSNSQSKPVPKRANETFLQKVVEALRITFEAIGSLGGDDLVAGEVWEATVDDSGNLQRRKLGNATDLAWPVRADAGQDVWVLQSRKLGRLLPDGKLELEAQTTLWSKLIGVTPDGTLLGFVTDGANSVPALRARSGELTRGLADDPDNASKLAKLRGDKRSYQGGLMLSVERSERGRRGFDVYLTRGSQHINISHCADDYCGQPSLTQAPLRVLYVRKPRY